MCLSLLCGAFWQSNAPQTERSSVLKRPSDSSSAASSVTPRDRVVSAAGTVRSTAPRKAPYTAGARRRRTRPHTSTRTQPQGQLACTAAQPKLKETCGSEATRASPHTCHSTVCSFGSSSRAGLFGNQHPQIHRSDVPELPVQLRRTRPAWKPGRGFSEQDDADEERERDQVERRRDVRCGDERRG